MISNVDLACYGVSRAKDRVSVDYGTSKGLIFCCLAFDVCSDVKYFYVGVSVCYRGHGRNCPYAKYAAA